MGKFIFSVLILFISANALAQKKGESVIETPQLPIDNITGKISYEAVVDADDLNAHTLYRRAMSWFQNYYKNPSEVIRENDSLNLKITGKPRFRISNPPDKTGLSTDAGLVQYTITVACRDGRFKYEITDFNWKQTSYYPCERWYDTALPSYNKVFDSYLSQTDVYTKSLIESLKFSMLNEKPVKNRDDW